MPPAVEYIDLAAARAVRVLGRGAMGTVFLVASAADGDSVASQTYALKVFDKRSVAAASASEALRRARWEVTVLETLASSASQAHGGHLPTLLGQAETGELMAWALPYCAGGDLNELRHAMPDRVFSPDAARFYVAEIVSALGDLHAAGIAYRDLKPENVLLRDDGHVTLTDFDLSRLLLPPPKSPSSSTSSSTSSPPPPRRRSRSQLRRILGRSESATTMTSSSSSSSGDDAHNLAWFLNRSENEKLKKAKSARVTPVSKKKKSFCSSPAASGGEKSFSFVGTEEYVAPEVVRGEGHEFAVDWWALGVLVYEMAYGRTPFRGAHRRETFRNVLLREPEFTADSRRRWPELVDLITRLLEKDPARRLGFAGGADEVRSHPFFAGVAWDLIGEVSRPPYIPPPADDDIVAGERFSVVEYFDKLHESPAAAPPPETEEEMTEFLPEF
uniref:non-specific serine/threonine protein kinase n=1 Tax=Leersia perrieri TaxID=77586 RepID=A0A0D9XF19_9ORYZ